MLVPKVLNIDNIQCYLAKEIFEYDRAFFIGCSAVRMREIIIKKKLQLDEYLFGLEVSNGIILKKDQSLRKAQLYLTKEYVDNNVPKFKNTITKSDYKYEIAPEMLYLSDEEKFKEENGKIINIEVRGDRKHDKVYFRMKDVSEGFEIPNLYQSLLEKTGKYEINTHFKYFSIVNKIKILENNTNTKTIQKEIFLTYKGILKVLFTSRTGSAEKFQDWACEKLFTIQMGTEEDKIKLSSKMIGMDLKTLKHLLGCNSYDKTPCVYLFMLGDANKLLKTEKYKNNEIICKFGYTKDLKERFEVHQRNYSKLFEEDELKIELITFGIVDLLNLAKAENKLYTLFEDKKLEYKNEQELIILDKTKLSKIKEHYTLIQSAYAGSYQNLIDEINELKNELKLKDKEIEIIKEKYENKLKDKEIEVLSIKLKLIENGIKY